MKSESCGKEVMTCIDGQTLQGFERIHFMHLKGMKGGEMDKGVIAGQKAMLGGPGHWGLQVSDALQVSWPD